MSGVGIVELLDVLPVAPSRRKTAIEPTSFRLSAGKGEY